MKGHTIFQKSQGILPNLVRETLEKSDNFIQNHCSPYICFQVTWHLLCFLVRAPPNMTNLFQPLDLTVNGVTKAFMKRRFTDEINNEE